MLAGFGHIAATESLPLPGKTATIFGFFWYAVANNRA